MIKTNLRNINDEIMISKSNYHVGDAIIKL